MDEMKWWHTTDRSMKLFILFPLVISSYGFGNECDSKSLEKLDDVDYIIGAFLPSHLYKAFSQSYELNLNAIVWASAIIYSINNINEDEHLLPNITLGYVVKDTCSRRIKAIRFAVEMILDTKYLMNQSLLENLTKNEYCIDDERLSNRLVGVVGGSSSPISASISNILSTYYIPQISYGSTSTALSDKKLYRSFLRAIPSDTYQAAAVAEIIAYFGWNYVSAFASDDAYGRIGLEELREYMKKYKICLAKDMLFSSPTITERDKRQIFDHLETIKDRSHVVILWCQVTEATNIIQEAANRGIKGITWVATETWGTNYFFRKKLRNVTGHVITSEIEDVKVPTFEKEFFSSSGKILCSNPWFLKFKDDSGFDGDLDCEYVSLLSRTLQPVKYQEIMSSIYSLAHGLHKYLNCTESKCHRNDGIINYQGLYNEILKVNFTLPGSDKLINFDEYGEIRNRKYVYRMADLKKLSHNSGDMDEYTLIGTWSDTININISAIRWGISGQPKSICSEVCQPGYYKIDGPSECCWSCAKCAENTVTSSFGETKCKPCKSIELANENHTFCRTLRNNTFKVKHLAGILITVFSVIGISIVIFIIVIYIILWDSHVIKSSSRELSIIQLTSLLVLFCLPVIEYFPRTANLCISRTLVFGSCLSTVIAVIVVKTYRLARIFDGRFSRVSKFFQNKYQITLVYSFVFLQLTVSALWFLCKRTKTEIVIIKASLSYHVTCGINSETIFWIVSSYIFLLALLSGYMAFRVRKLPENYNEAQFICLSMFTACILWLIYIPLYLSLHGVSAVLAFLSINNTSTLAVLLILYAYRLYIVLFCPQMNCKEYYHKASANFMMRMFRRRSKTKNNGAVTQMFNMLTIEQEKRSPDQQIFVPARRYSISAIDRDTPETYMEMKPIIKHRGSFSTTTMLEKVRMFNDMISIETLLQPLPRAKLTTYRSTPNLSDSPKTEVKKFVHKTLSGKPFEKMSRSISQLFSRMTLMNSLTNIFSHNKDQILLEAEDLLLNGHPYGQV